MLVLWRKEAPSEPEGFKPVERYAKDRPIAILQDVSVSTLHLYRPKVAK